MNSTFIPSRLSISFANYASNEPKFLETNKNSFTRAQKEGIKYEKKVHSYLDELVLTEPNSEFVVKHNPWLIYRTNDDPVNRIRFCQPDAMIISEKNLSIILVEIKYQHTNEAWKQLRLLYEPIVRFIHRPYHISCLEICRWFDPHIFFNEHFYYNENPLRAITNQLGVHIYRPRKEKRILKSGK